MIDLILSIKPCFSNEIYSGRKVVELRKRLGKHFLPSAKMFIYTSSPIKAITGYVIIDKIERMKVADIKVNHLIDACIAEDDFDRYYQYAEFGSIIWIGSVVRFERQIQLSTLLKYNFTAPQSYCYVTDSIKQILDEAK